MPRAHFHLNIGRIVASLGACLALTRMLEAAEEPAAAPVSFVLDDARLFDAATVEGMGRALEETERACGVAVYVATSSYLKTADTRTRERQLVESWLGDKPGVILTYVRGNGQTGILPSPELWRRHPADEIARLLTEAGRILFQPGSEPEQRIRNTVTLLSERLRQLDEDRRSPRGPFTGIERTLAIAVAATIALALLVCWLGASVRRRKAAVLGGPFWFPEASVKPRLGGQFGGSIGESSTRLPD